MISKYYKYMHIIHNIRARYIERLFIYYILYKHLFRGLMVNGRP